MTEGDACIGGSVLKAYLRFNIRCTDIAETLYSHKGAGILDICQITYLETTIVAIIILTMPEAHLQGVGGGIHLGQDNLVVGGVVGAKRITAAVGISAGTISAHGIAVTTGRIWNGFPATGYVDITCTVLEIHRERDSLGTAGGPGVDARSVTVLATAAVGLHLEAVGGVGGQAGDGDTRSSEVLNLCGRDCVVFSVGDDIGSRTVVVVIPRQRDAGGGGVGLGGY